MQINLATYNYYSIIPRLLYSIIPLDISHIEKNGSTYTTSAIIAVSAIDMTILKFIKTEFSSASYSEQWLMYR